MRVYGSCYPCSLRFAVRTMKACGLDEGEMVPLLREISKMMAQEEFVTPAHLGTAIQRFIVEKTGILDPYLNEKKEQNRLALSVYSRVLKICLLYTSPSPRD